MIKHLWGAALLTLSLGAQAQLNFGQNLIVNGDAENGTTGWTVFDGYQNIQSVSYGSNWVLPTEPGPSNRGLQMFAGLGARAAAYQTLDLSGLGDLGSQTVQYDLTGWLGGWQSQGDNALLYVSFLDAFGNEIGHADIGPVTAADRGNKTGLLLRQNTGLLPTGTTSLMFSLSMERLVSSDNDGYADNLSFVLTTTPVPEASTLAYALMGIGLLSAAARRRRAG